MAKSTSVTMAMKPLEVRLLMLFTSPASIAKQSTLTGADASDLNKIAGKVTRWERRPVVGATVEIVDLIGVFASKATADANGVAKLAMDEKETGPFILRITPKAGQETGSNEPAGPSTASAAQSEPQFRWRPFEVNIRIENNPSKSLLGLQTSPSPSIDAPKVGAPFATVVHAEPFKLLIDYRPDWIMRKNKTGDEFTIKFGRQGRTKDPDLVVLHQTAVTEHMGSQINALAVGSGPTAHYLSDVDGHVVKMVHEKNEAPHVKGAFWVKQEFINNRSIGVENNHADVISFDDDGKKVTPPKNDPHPFPKPQLDAIVRLVQQFQTAFGIARQNVAGHADTETNSDGNKAEDPGVMFEWRRLEDVGAARKRDPSVTFKSTDVIYGISSLGELKAGSTGDGVKELQRDLRKIGYDVKETGHYDALTQRWVGRFQRRFFAVPNALPANLGVCDFETAKSVKQVLADAPPAVATVSSFTAAPASAGTTTAPLVEATAADGAPALLFIQPDEEVLLSWAIAGKPEGVRIEPGGLDVTDRTQDGKGSIAVKPKREAGKGGVVSFKLTVVAGGDEDAADRDAQVVFMHNIPVPVES
jgi:N-acetyl-anhydromuramyl-L-alanine amidase AmpD